MAAARGLARRQAPSFREPLECALDCAAPAGRAGEPIGLVPHTEGQYRLIWTFRQEFGAKPSRPAPLFASCNVPPKSLGTNVALLPQGLAAHLRPKAPQQISGVLPHGFAAKGAAVASTLCEWPADQTSWAMGPGPHGRGLPPWMWLTRGHGRRARRGRRCRSSSTTVALSGAGTAGAAERAITAHGDGRHQHK